MSDVRRVVFLIHPSLADFEKKENSVKWQQTVYTTALKILTQFECNSDLPLTWSEKGNIVTSLEISKNLQWGHKFVHKSGIKFHTGNDLKSLSEDNFICFQDELKFNEEDENKSDFCAHTLADNLIEVAHDFKWEQHEIISPVKQVRKRSLLGNRKRNRLSGQPKNLTESNGKNFIFIIGPIPKTKNELNSYFEWNISDVNDITNVLMPTHLATHFRDKHDIRFFWLDSSPDSVERSYLLGKSNIDAESLLEKFLNANNGCVIPIPLLTNLINEKPKTRQLLSTLASSTTGSESETCNFNDTGLNDSVFEGYSKQLHKISKYSIIAQHLKNKNTNLSKSYSPCSMSYQFEDNKFCSLNFTKIFLRTNNLKPFHLFHEISSKYLKGLNSVTTCKILGNVNNLRSILNLNIPHVDHEMPEIIQNLENIDFFVLGHQYTHLLPILQFNGLSLIGGQNQTLRAFQSIVKIPCHNNLVYIVKSHCSLCEPSFQQYCCIHHRIGIFHPVGNGCAAISWINEPQRSSLSGLLTLCQQFLPQQIQFGDFIAKCYQDFTSTKIQDNNIIKMKPTKAIGDYISFEPEMVEPWFATANTSTQFQQLCSNLKSETCTPVTENDSDFLEFNDLIISQLQSNYKTLPSDNTNQKINNSEDIYKPLKLPDYNDPKLAIDAVMFEYQSTLDRFGNEPSLMKLSAHDIIQSFCRLSNKGSTIAFDKIEKLLMQNIFVSAAKIRSKNETQEKKTAEYFLQILLKMEWLCYKLPLSEDQDEFIVEESEIIIQLLRAISISESPEKMTKFLSEILVESYFSLCGRVLYEIHSDLMLPIPASLEQYSTESGVDDSFFAPPSNRSDLPSMGPFSMTSSVGSHCSDDLRPTKQFKLRRTSHITSNVTRNIVMPETKKITNRQRSKTVDTSNTRFKILNNTKLMPEKIPQPMLTEKKLVKNVSQEMVRVRRDLFASPSKSARKKLKSEADLRKLKKNTNQDIRKSRHNDRRKGLSVLDTPVAKQRMTALARQRLRMRRSHENKTEGENMTVVEESPMKMEEENVLVSRPVNSVTQSQPRSPRHSVMLTRQHSFYRGSDPKSRTVARAEVVQQHQKAHPATPKIVQPKITSTKTSSLNPTFSPKSLLFSYSGQKSGEKSSEVKKDPPQKGRRRLQLLSTSESQDSTKNKFTFKKSIAFDQLAVNAAKVHSKSPETSPSSIFAAYKTNEKKTNVVNESNNPITTEKQNTNPEMSKSQSPLRNDEEKTIEPVTPDNLTKTQQIDLNILGAPPPLIKQVGPLDNYITRTPTPDKKSRKISLSVSSKRKPSPNGDHIHCWPRKKRAVDSCSSPGFVAKRSKTESGLKCGQLFFSDESIMPIEENNTLEIPKSNKLIESPDLSVYIVSDGDNANQKISKLPFADGPKSPGIDVNQYFNTLNTTFKTPSKRTDLLNDIGGVFPFSEPQSLPTLTRFQNREGTLFHARCGSPSSKKHVPMMLLNDNLDETIL